MTVTQRDRGNWLLPSFVPGVVHKFFNWMTLIILCVRYYCYFFLTDEENGGQTDRWQVTWQEVLSTLLPSPRSHIRRTPNREGPRCWGSEGDLPGQDRLREMSQDEEPWGFGDREGPSTKRKEYVPAKQLWENTAADSAAGWEEGSRKSWGWGSLLEAMGSPGRTLSGVGESRFHLCGGEI